MSGENVEMNGEEGKNPAAKFSGSRTMNEVILIGNVGVAPVLRQTSNGSPITNMRIATHRITSTGETKTDWHNILCWGKLAEIVSGRVTKGDRICVTGHLQYREVAEEGSDLKRFIPEIYARDVIFLTLNNNNRTQEEKE